MTKLHPKVQMMKDDVKELEKHVKQIAMENRIEACNEEIEAMEVIDVITDKYDARSGNIKNLERCTKKEIYQDTNHHQNGIITKRRININRTKKEVPHFSAKIK